MHGENLKLSAKYLQGCGENETVEEQEAE